MKRIPIYDYFAFGYNYNILRFSKKGMTVHGESNSLLDRINEFLSYADGLNLQVTNQAAGMLRLIQSRVKKLPVDSKMDGDLETEVHEAIEQLDKTLDAELQLRYAYIVTPKRFDLDNLLYSPGNLFAKGVYSTLPTITQFDFAQACHCIGFALSTAAAFHLMRGTEGALRYYYTTIVKRGRTKSLMWNAMIMHLRKRSDVPKKSLLDHLDNIRINFRNPTQHPDARYDLDQAQDLLSLSIDATNQMMKDLFARELIVE